METSSFLLAHSALPPLPQTRTTSAGKKKLIYDQGHRGPLSTNTVTTLMLLQVDNIELIGIKLVTGDAWMSQEMAQTLRSLERMGHAEIPEYAGAEFPMLNTKFVDPSILSGTAAIR